VTSKAESGKSTTKEKAAETHKEQDELLNRELEDTFPASDPPSSTQPTTEIGGPDRQRHKAKPEQARRRSESSVARRTLRRHGRV
jgi:hypothetical protein